MKAESLSEQHPFDSVKEAIEAIQSGGMVIVTDDESRENEGDLIMAASKATPEAVGQMIRDCSGIICVPMLEAELSKLGIHQMVAENREVQRTDFTVSVDAADGITTGISAADRCATVRVLADRSSKPEQLVQPGHIFPLRAKPGGVLQRAGHTEAATDLARLAGFPPVGVICELMNPDGSVMRLPDLVQYKQKYQLKMVSIASLIEYRHQREQLVEEVLKTDFESEFGTFKLHIFRSQLDKRQHYALTIGDIGPDPTLVRVHSENILADLFKGTPKGGSGPLQRSLEAVAKAGEGVVVYIEQPDGGLALRADSSGQPQMHPMKMDFRDYGIGAQILRQLGLNQIRLLSTSGKPKVVALDGFGLEICEVVAVDKGHFD